MIGRFDVTHDSQSLRVMVSRFHGAGVSKVAIERGDGPVVQLIDAGLSVFVVSSRQIKPYGPATDWRVTRITAGARMSSRTRYVGTVHW